MRGRFADQGGLFSYISPEERVPSEPSAAEDPGSCPRGSERSEPQPWAALRQRGTALDPSGAIAERFAAAGVLRHPLGTPVDGAAGLQSFVSLVRGAFAGRSGLGPDRLHQEPGAAAERRCVHEVHDQASEPSAGQAAAVGRAFLGGWNADRGLGLTEELSPQGRQRRRRRRRELPWPEAQERHACRAPATPTARLYRKAAGREARLCYMGHAVMENRHGLAVAGMVTHANGTAERRASETMLKAKSKAAGRRITAGEDKAYDTADHVANLRAIERHAACDAEQRPSPKPARAATAPSTNAPRGMTATACRNRAAP